ncbi:MAG: hypothetical protein Q8O32_01965, partial [bacterium]|nr:hypothetical protein [bacterium]
MILKKDYSLALVSFSFVSSLSSVFSTSVSFFSVLGVLLQSILSNVAYDVRTYLGYIGGIIIIF